MQKLAASFCAVLGGLFLFANAATAQQSPTVALKVVKMNPVCAGGTNDGHNCARPCDCPGGICGGDITPTDTITGGQGGDRFVLEIYASEWSPSPQPERLRAWETGISSDVLNSGRRGSLKIREGFRCCQPHPPFFVSSNSDCQDLNVLCTSNTSLGICNTGGPDQLPRAAGAYIERYRSDYAFVGNSELPALDLADPNLVRYQSALTSAADAEEYTVQSQPKYLATLVLESTADACGVFDVELTSGSGNTTLLSTNNTIIVDPDSGELNVKGVHIDLGPCTCNKIISSVPDICLLDAEEPKTPTGTNETINSIRVELDCDRPNALPNSAPSNFIMTTLGAGTVPPTITGTSVQTPGPNGGIYVNVSFAPGTLKTKAWNCIQYDPTGPQAPDDQKWCFGVLPADVDGNSLVEPGDGNPSTIVGDLDALNECITHVGTCALERCDMDRSGMCTPADRLRWIDMFQGAASYSIWADEGIVDGSGVPIACPMPVVP